MVASLGLENVAHQMRRQDRAGRVLEGLPGSPETVEDELAVGAVFRLAVSLIGRLVEAHLRAVRQRHRGIGQIGIGKLSISEVRLLKHIARGREKALTFQPKGVGLGPQDVAQEKSEARGKLTVLAFEGHDAAFAERENLWRKPGRLFPDEGVERARLLAPFLVGGVGQVLVRPEAGIGVEAAGCLVDAADFGQRVQKFVRARAQRAFEAVQLRRPGLDGVILGRPSIGRWIKIGKIPHQHVC